MSHKVYIMRTDNFSKIGITSSSIESRMKQVQTGTPTKIHRIEYYIVKDRATAFRVEKSLHNKLKSRRTYGEWFKNLRNASSELTLVLAELGLHREDMRVLDYGRTHKVDDELAIVSKNIDKCLRDTDFDRLVGLGKKIMVNPIVERVRRVELKYKDALSTLHDRQNHVLEEERLAKDSV